MSRRHLAALAAVGVLAATTATACTASSPQGGTRIAVSSTDDACVLNATSAPAGPVIFAVSNDGSRVSEFYVYASDGKTIKAEVENIGPGITRELVVTLAEGAYVTACDPGMDGDDLRGDFTAIAAGSAAATITSPELEAAAADYLAYVRGEVASLVTATKQFADAVNAGDVEAARALYPQARSHWERIEPVAESFGDLDPKLDLREADLGPQEQWTGWHHLEKILWPPAEGYTVDDATLASLTKQLVADTEDLSDRVSDPAFVLDAAQVGNGAKELLDEVAATKVTGEEDIWSGTDLWDIQANVDGARRAYESLKPIVAAKDPDLVATLDDRFGAVQSVLATHGNSQDGFVAYGTLSHDQVLELSRAVESLSEPLARLTAAAVL